MPNALWAGLNAHLSAYLLGRNAAELVRKQNVPTDTAVVRDHRPRSRSTEPVEA